MLITEEGVRRLQGALDRITDHPEEWDQMTWLQFLTPDGVATFEWDRVSQGDCGTACCLAGRLVLNEGATYSRICSGVSNSAVEYQGVTRDIPGLAVELLTGDPKDLYYFFELFDPENTLAKLWRIAQLLAEGRLTVPEEIPT